MDICRPDDCASMDLMDNAPDRMWRKVLHCVDTGKPPSRREEDKVLREGYRFIKRWGSAVAANMFDLWRKFPNLTRAYVHYSTPSPTKWILEAGLVARDAWPTLCTEMSLAPGVYEHYKKFFFDVESLLTPLYLQRYITKRIGAGNIMPYDQDYLYKTVAYCFGWDVFKEYISYGIMSKEVEAKIIKGIRSHELRNCMSANYAVPINNYTALELIRVIKETQGNEKMPQEEKSDRLTEILNSVFAACKMSVIKSTETLPAHEPRAFDPDKGFVVRMDPLPSKRLDVEV